MSQGRVVNDSDCLKKLNEVFVPDPRNMRSIIYDAELQARRPFTFEDYYKQIEQIRLNDSVPHDVFIEFEKARNLYLYTWFVYRFNQIVELQAFATVELALKTRLGEETHKGLRKLLLDAIKEGWIHDEGFRQYNRMIVGREKLLEELEAVAPEMANRLRKAKKGGYVNMLTETLPELRNNLAHGSLTLLPNIFLTVEICCDIINQLFTQPCDDKNTKSF